MFSKRVFTTIPLLITTAILGACGGGSDGMPGSTSEDITSVGTISEFGSVVVNNRHYDTSNAEIISAETGEVIIANPTDDEVRQ